MLLLGTLANRVGWLWLVTMLVLAAIPPALFFMHRRGWRLQLRELVGLVVVAAVVFWLSTSARFSTLQTYVLFWRKYVWWEIGILLCSTLLTLIGSYCFRRGPARVAPKRNTRE
jgi:hypothetical protein